MALSLLRRSTFRSRNSASLSLSVSNSDQSRNRRQINATRFPKHSAVSMSPMLGVASSALLCPMAPSHVPRRFKSLGEPPL